MDLAAIGAFVAVADTGGFRAAASTLGMSSAGVSKAVARLEAQLGVTLVARTTRAVRLTAAGTLFHRRCTALLAELDQARREAAAAGAALPNGRLVIGMTRAFGRLRVLPAIADFAVRFPQVEIEVRASDRPVDLVAEGVDLAVRIGHLPDSGLIATRVAQTRFVLCAAPAYLAATVPPTHPDDLHRHRFVGYVAPDTATRFACRFMVDGAVRTIVPPAQVTVDDGEALVAAAVDALGLAMANDYLMERDIAAGRLVRLLRGFEMPAVPISVVHLPTRTPSAAARAFTALLRDRLREEA